MTKKEVYVRYLKKIVDNSGWCHKKEDPFLSDCNLCPIKKYYATDEICDITKTLEIAKFLLKRYKLEKLLENRIVC
jgi:hypothetical protein